MPMETGKTLSFSLTFAILLFSNHVKCTKITNYDSEVTRWMDPSVDPCDNFYGFVCGNYNKRMLPQESFLGDNFVLLTNSFEEKLKVIIEDYKFSEKDSKVFDLLKTFYNTCTDTETIEKTSENDFRDILQKLGGWPVLEGNGWNESNFDWKKTDLKLRKMGYNLNSFITFYVDLDWKNTSRRVIYVDQAVLELNREILLLGAKEKMVRAYFKYMIDLAEIFGATSRLQAQKELSESIFFEIQLAKISITQRNRSQHSNYNKITLKELQIKYPNIHWKEYMNNILSSHNLIDYSDTIVLLAPAYFDFFFDLISKTPKRVLANYAIWRVAMKSASFLSQRVRNAEKEFLDELTTIRVVKTRWKICIEAAYNHLPVALEALYARKYACKEETKSVLEILNNVKEVFKNLLIESNWMDSRTKLIALKKLDNLVARAAVPNEFYDDKKLNEYYQNFEVHSESYLRSHLSSVFFHQSYHLKLLSKPVNRTDWREHIHPLNAIAYYIPQKNIIGIPGLILQDAFYSSEGPHYRNYACIGSIIGHELTHAIQGGGDMFDEMGNILDWWKPTSKKTFYERGRCFENQYSRYTVLGTNINGTSTLYENISDNVGVKVAYLAYTQFEREKKVEPCLQVANYSYKQLFWISFAQMFCSKYQPEMLKSLIKGGYHSPKQFRVNGVFSNIREFSNDFECPLFSKMNPPKKCTMW